jgi:hypothetical protein
MKHLKRFNESESLGKDDSQKWALYAGLSGGFGGANFKEFFEGSKEDADSQAYQLAIEEYSQYEGLHGLRTVSDIIDEDDVDEDEAEEIYNEEREGWLDYHSELFDENKNYE